MDRKVGTWIGKEGLLDWSLFVRMFYTPPRTWPIQRARTYQKRVATAHAGHPIDILIVHSFWHQNASDDWTKEILPSDIMVNFVTL